MKHHLTFIIISLLITLLACTKDNEPGNVAIPYVEVNERIDINLPQYQSLNNIGGWAYVEAGVKGIILYRENNDIFLAYERQCPYDPNSVCSTTDVNPFTNQIEDSDCCGSIYKLSNGTVFQGPAFNPLKQYNARLEGTLVVITN